MNTGVMKKVMSLFTFSINHSRMKPATKAISSQVGSGTNATALPRKLKIATTTLPTIADNISMVFPTSFSKGSASLFIHFFKTLSSFGDPDVAGATSSNNDACYSKHDCCVVIPFSRNKVRILSVKYVSLSRTFPMVCLILPTYVCRSFQFWDSISIIAFLSVFKLPSLSSYSCLCSLE